MRLLEKTSLIRHVFGTLDRDRGVERLRRQFVCQPIAEKESRILASIPALLRECKLRLGNRHCGNFRAAGREEARARAISATDIAHTRRNGLLHVGVFLRDAHGISGNRTCGSVSLRHARLARDEIHELQHRLLPRFISSQPKAMVHMIAPDVPVEVIKLVVCEATSSRAIVRRDEIISSRAVLTVRELSEARLQTCTTYKERAASITCCASIPNSFMT